MRIADAAALSKASPGSVDEDGVLVLESPALGAVADGKGGPGTGDLAAAVALDAISRKAALLEKLARATETDKTSGARLALGRTLERLFGEAHAEISSAGRPGMAATLADGLTKFISGNSSSGAQNDNAKSAATDAGLYKKTNGPGVVSQPEPLLQRLGTRTG